MRTLATIFLMTLGTAYAGPDQFRLVGDYLLRAHYKLTGAEMTPIPMKPIAFRVTTDGITVRISPEGDEESHTSYDIYRSDGIGRQRAEAGALEVIPGIQAYSNTDGTLRHLRLSRESLTITAFPGVSDQTVVSYAVAAAPKEPEPASQP
ncbi:hypothetical protein HZ994_03255 [Akkermansiaceae bacterium]|nr:hypothetical protein HZ994_03255 [Akkermansiaceae bacterium]